MLPELQNDSVQMKWADDTDVTVKLTEKSELEFVIQYKKQTSIGCKWTKAFLNRTDGSPRARKL